MIYEHAEPEQPIRQGDIFFPLPLPVVPLGEIAVAGKDGIRRPMPWLDVDAGHEELTCVMPVKRTWAIVASQDCDAAYSTLITFFAIGTFEEVTKLNPPSGGKNQARWWSETLTKKARLYAKWFYLPQDEEIGFSDRMAVDFRAAFCLRRKELDRQITQLRRGRLGEIAYEHYRECIAQYYRRYPYNEWYPLSQQEFEAYARDTEVERFPWQE